MKMKLEKEKKSTIKMLQCMIGENKFLSKSTISKRTKLSFEKIDIILTKLKNKGYDFSFSPRLGYKLIDYPKELNSILIKAGLNTKLLGSEIRVFKEVSSTNKKLLHYSPKVGEEGTVVIAETQSKGKGRQDRVWVSPKGGIYLSLLLKPEKRLPCLSIFNLLGAISVAETLEKLYNLPISIKWPNDVMLEGRKISGILSEIELQSEDIIVIGIGINVNSNFKKLPLNSVSIKDYIKQNKDVDRIKIIWELLKNIEEKYFLFQNSQIQQIVKEWKFYSGLLGEQVKISSATGEIIKGYVNNLDPNSGAIILRNDKGVEKVILEGTVEKL